MKNNNIYKILVSRVKRNFTSTLIATFVVIVLGFIYIPQLTAQFKVVPSEAFDAGIYPGPVDSGTPVKGGPPQPWVNNGLAVSLAPDTPQSGQIADNANENFTKFILTAALGTTVSVNQIYVTRQGSVPNSDLENIKIIGSNGVQVGYTAGGFNANNKAQILFSPSLKITGAKSFYIRAGIVDGTESGLTARLGIAANTDIIASTSLVKGAPVFGNFMDIVQITIGVVTLSEDGSVTDSNPGIGDTGVLTNTFRLTAGSLEKITIERITVLRYGTAGMSDTTNIELYDVTHDVSLGITNWTFDSKASWPLNINLNQGETIRLSVKMDVLDGAGLTFNSDVTDGGDALVIAKGELSGWYVTPSYDNSIWNGRGDEDQTISSGSLVFSKSPVTPIGNIVATDDQFLAVWDANVSGDQMRISVFTVRGDLTENSGSALTYADLTNARLVDMATGNILAGPVNGLDGAGVVGTTGVDPMFVFTNTFVLNVGITRIGFKVNLNSDWHDGDTIQVELYQAPDFTVKNLSTNDTVIPTGFVAAGNVMTVGIGALNVHTLGNPPDGNVVIGTTNFRWSSFVFDASGSSEDIRVTGVTITDVLDGIYGNMADINSAAIWLDSDNNGTYETKIAGNDYPIGGGGASDVHKFTFAQLVIVPKGGSIGWIMIGDLALNATPGGTHNISVFAGGADAVGVETGDTITDTASGTAGTLTVVT